MERFAAMTTGSTVMQLRLRRLSLQKGTRTTHNECHSFYACFSLVVNVRSSNDSLNTTISMGQDMTRIRIRSSISKISCGAYRGYTPGQLPTFQPNALRKSCHPEFFCIDFLCPEFSQRRNVIACELLFWHNVRQLPDVYLR